MAMSEPDAGTDVLGLSTTAVQQEDGTWKINGRKMWITNGVLDESGTPADIVWVYAKTGTDEKGRVQPTMDWNFQRKHFDGIVPEIITVEKG